MSIRRVALLPLAVAAILVGAPAPSNAEKPYAIEPDEPAVAAADQFLKFIDTGEYQKARNLMAKRVRAGGTTADNEMINYLKARRAPLGRRVSRMLYKAKYSTTLSSAPDGRYEFLYYRTIFERKAEAHESVTLTKESGHWEVSGYQFQ